MSFQKSTVLRWTALTLAFTIAAYPQTAPTREQALAAMRKAAAFFNDKVATHGGYHFVYADDLSYGRSEQSEGPTKVEVQREGTPIAGMAFLEAFDATGDVLFLNAARATANALVEGQLCNGGWDYFIEFDPEKRRTYPYLIDGGCDAKKPRATTLDDNVTQAATRLMMRVDRALEFKDARIRESAKTALDGLLRAQFPNGAWPQRYTTFPDPAAFPVRKASYPDDWPRKWPNTPYFANYTFNDNSIADAIDTMLEAARTYKDPRYLESARRGGDFILLAQMPDPQPAWAQQYDLNMHPAWARQFEPPSITGGESQANMRILLVLYRETGDKKYLEPIPRALAYLERSVLPPVQSPSEIRRRVDRGGPALARFYELRTNKPLYITKGTQIQATGVGSARIDGYEVSYSDESVITHYAVLISAAGLKDLRAAYDRYASTEPGTTRRPDKLYGLSPWSGDESGIHPGNIDHAKVAQIAASLDERGAWTEEGTIGKADRVVSVFAGRNMVLTINGRPTTIRENDRIELFEGTLPPRTKVVRTATFASNLRLLAAYVAATKR
jgi:PelA/Pel-15E family pectate lyase